MFENNENNENITDENEPLLFEEEELEPIDDTWIENEDKLLLVTNLKKFYENKFDWSPDYLINIFVTHHYREIVKLMSVPEQKEQYLREKEEQKDKENNPMDISEFLKN